MATITPPTATDNGLFLRFLASFLGHSNIPLRMVLWNGWQHDLGPTPRVTIEIPGPSALRYFVPASLDNLAEGYIHGHFQVQGSIRDLVDVATKLAQATVPLQGKFARILNSVGHDRSMDASAISHHYDVSNEFYRAWLDEKMVYSCAYFPSSTESLDDAQSAKLDHILHKIMLRPGERLLDIGCGWGALPIRAAQRFGARVVGVTLSQNQYAWARERVERAGLNSQVEIRLQDYRDIEAPGDLFDKITSVGMFEHVGLKHLPEYFEKIHSLLKDGGLALNHGITSTDPDSGSTPLGAAKFIDKFIFPNGELPHISLALHKMQGAGLEVLDVECLRRHYTRTLELWAEKYENSTQEIRSLVSESTFRTWRVYLTGCAFAFENNWVSLHQVLACKAGSNESLNPTPWSRGYMYPTAN